MNIRASSSSAGSIPFESLTILLAGTLLVSAQAFVAAVDRSHDQVEGPLSGGVGAGQITERTPETTPTDGRCAGDEKSTEKGQGETCETAGDGTPTPNEHAHGS